MTEDTESVDITPFFQLLVILLSRVPITLKEFGAYVSTEDLAFVWSLSLADRQGFFADSSRIPFRDESLVLMVFAGQDNVLGSSDLSREQDGLKEKCEILTQ